jgi:hypothetical protein
VCASKNYDMARGDTGTAAFEYDPGQGGGRARFVLLGEEAAGFFWLCPLGRRLGSEPDDEN